MGPVLVIIHSGTAEDKVAVENYAPYLPVRVYDLTVKEEAKIVESVYARDDGSTKLPILFWEYTKIPDNPLLINDKEDNCWEKTYPELGEIIKGFMFGVDSYFTDLEIQKRIGKNA